MANKEYVFSTVIQVLDKATKPLQMVGKGFGAAAVNMNKASNYLSQMSDKMNKFGSSVSNTGKSLMGGLTLPILGVGAASLKAFGEFEMMTANFITMFQGNEKAAKAFLSQIEAFANATPYTTAGLAKNAQVMMSFGLSSEQTMKTLKQLGDIAGGNTERMNALSLAFAQVSSAGKLQGQDLLQMINAGFNPLQIISKQTGKSMAELKDIMSKGGISAQAVARAFELATSKGGLFYQGADRGSKTLFGLFSTLKDEGEKSLRMLGETLKDSLELSKEIPKLTERISKLTKSVSEWIKANPEMTKFLVKFLLLAATLGPVLFIFGKTVTTVAATVKAFSYLGKTLGAIKILGGVAFNPMLAGIAAATVAAYGLNKALDSAVEKFLDMNTSKWGKAAISMLSQIPGIGGVFNLKTAKELESRTGMKVSSARDMEAAMKKYQSMQEAKKGETEITVKVEAEQGTTATISKVKSKGNSDPPKINSSGYLGAQYQMGW